MVQQRACRSDRVGAEEHRQVGELRSGDEAQRQRFRAGDGTVEARFGGSGVDMMLVDPA